jgi:hypothetical protein
MRVVMVVASASRTSSTRRSRRLATRQVQDELRGAPHQPGVAHLDPQRRCLTFIVSTCSSPASGRWSRCGGSSRRSSAAARSLARSSPRSSRSSPRRVRHVREVVTSSKRGRRVAQRPQRSDGRQLLRLLDGHRARGADGRLAYSRSWGRRWTRRGRRSSRCRSTAWAPSDARFRPPSSRSASWPSASSAWVRSPSRSTRTVPSRTTRSRSTS